MSRKITRKSSDFREVGGKVVDYVGDWRKKQ